MVTQDSTPVVVDDNTQPLVPGDAKALSTPNEDVCTTPADVKAEMAGTEENV
jgi:hypothetical protein